VNAKLRERLATSKQAAQTFDVGKFGLRMLRELEVRKHYQIKSSYRFAALENLSDSKNINRAWQTIQEKIKISTKDSLGLYELKQHKSWSDEEFLRFLDQMKKVKILWLQDPNQGNVDNLNR